MEGGRYSRQERLPGFGKEAQQNLEKARVLIIGLGGLGVPVAQYLNAMGVGTLGLVDHDTVATSNLHRQVLYTEKDVGKSKVEAAINFLSTQNSSTHFKIFNNYLDGELALKLFPDFDIIVDASDNFDTRYTINDICVRLNKPMVYGALHGYEGQLTVFNYQNGPTYRCLYPEPPESGEIPNCDAHGVIGVLPGIVGTLQALEVVKIATGIGEVTSGKMLLFNGLNTNFYEFSFKRRPAAAALAINSPIGNTSAISSEALLRMLEKDPLQLVDVRSEPEFMDYHIPNATHISMDDIISRKEEINFSIPVYLICESGLRSGKAQKDLLKIYPDAKIFNVLGGMAKIRALCF